MEVTLLLNSLMEKLSMQNNEHTMPTDDEVRVAVIHLENSLDYTNENTKSNIVQISKKDAETLIRRATQPKSCTVLVEALRKVNHIFIVQERNGISDDLASDGMELIKNALAEHRKGECDDRASNA